MLSVEVYDFTTNEFETIEVDEDESAFNVVMRMAPALEKAIEDGRASGRELVRVSFTWFHDGDRARRWLAEG